MTMRGGENKHLHLHSVINDLFKTASIMLLNLFLLPNVCDLLIEQFHRKCLLKCCRIKMYEWTIWEVSRGGVGGTECLTCVQYCSVPGNRFLPGRGPPQLRSHLIHRSAPEQSCFNYRSATSNAAAGESNSSFGDAVARQPRLARPGHRVGAGLGRAVRPGRQGLPRLSAQRVPPRQQVSVQAPGRQRARVARQQSARVHVLPRLPEPRLLEVQLQVYPLHEGGAGLSCTDFRWPDH